MTRDYLLRSIGALCVCTLLFGCETDTITNEMQPAGGAIYGRVSPAEPGTEVAAWQAKVVKSTTVDAEGYFTLSGLQPGFYRVIARAPSGLNKEIRDIAVDNTRNVALGVVALNDLPSLFSDFYPSHGDSGIALNAQIRITTIQRLSLASLSTAVQLSPATSGQWYETSAGPNQYFYRYYTSSRTLQPFTTYEVTIGPSLELYSGEGWGETYSSSFRTASFRLLRWYFARQSPLQPLYTGRIAQLEFDAPIDLSSTEKGIRIEPDVTTTVAPYGSEELQVSIVDGLVPNQDYWLIINQDLMDLSGQQFGSVDTLLFSTEAFAVSSARFGPSNGSPVAPGVDLSASLTFNYRVDVNALNSAALFDPHVEGFWLGQGNSFAFFPSGPSNLVPDQTYEFRIRGDVNLNVALSLGTDYLSTFVIDPVRVTSTSPNNGVQTVYPSSSIHIYFNTPMHRISTETAFSLQELNGTPVTGTLTWTSTSRNFQFRPTVALKDGQSYVISVTTAATSELGPTLKEAVTSYFRTR